MAAGTFSAASDATATGAKHAPAHRVRAAAAMTNAQMVAWAVNVETKMLNAFMNSPAQGRYYAAGVWHNPGPSCWSCLDGAATAAAVMSQQSAPHNATLARVAIDTFNYAIAHNQLADGSFAGNPAIGQPAGITTGFVGVELGTTYLELRSTLDPATRAAWSRAIGRAADFLINSGQTTWYVNGNVNLRQTEVLWLAWQTTGVDRYRQAFESEYTFTISPPPRWAGFGLRITRAPTLADASDGAGYLAEAGGGAPGYDPWYTTVQLDTDNGSFVLSRDKRFLRLMNLELNQLLPRINSNWMLNASGGTRKNYPVAFFYDTAPETLVAIGDRPDLANSISQHLATVQSDLLNPAEWNNPNLYLGMSEWVAPILLNAQHPGGLATVTATTTARRSAHK